MNTNYLRCSALMKCMLCIFICQLVERGHCQRPLNANGTAQQPAHDSATQSEPVLSSTKLLHQLNRQNRLTKQLNRSSSSEANPKSYSPIDDGIFNVNGAAAASPVRPYHDISDQASVYLSDGKYYSSKPTASDWAGQPNRGRKHTFTELRKNLTSVGHYNERQGDDPDRNDQNNPMALLKNRLMESDVSILFQFNHHKLTLSLPPRSFRRRPRHIQKPNE